MIDPSSSEEESDDDQGGKGGRATAPSAKSSSDHHPPSAISAANARAPITAAGAAVPGGHHAVADFQAHSTPHHVAGGQVHHPAHPGAKDLHGQHIHHAGSDTSGSLEVPSSAMPSLQIYSNRNDD